MRLCVCVCVCVFWGTCVCVCVCIACYVVTRWVTLHPHIWFWSSVGLTSPPFSSLRLFFFINTQILFATFGLGQKQRLRTGGNKPQDTPRRKIGLRFIFFLWQRLCRSWLAFAAGVGARRFWRSLMMRDGGHCSLGESRSASSHSVEDVSRPSNAQLSSSRRLSWVQCGFNAICTQKRLQQKVKIDFLCTFSDFCSPMWCFQTLRCGCPLTMRQWGGKVSRSVSASTELVSPSEKRSAALNVAVCVGCGRVTIRWPLREFARKRFRESPGRVWRRHRVAVHREGRRLNSLRPPQFVDPILHSRLCMLLLRITHSCRKQVVVVSLILCFSPYLLNGYKQGWMSRAMKENKRISSERKKKKHWSEWEEASNWKIYRSKFQRSCDFCEAVTSSSY